MHWIELRCPANGKPGKPLQVTCTGPMVDASFRNKFCAILKAIKTPARCGLAMPPATSFNWTSTWELLDSVFIYDQYGKPISYDFWMNITTLVDWICKHWRTPDEGIWEVRGGARPFLYSRAMCWVAIDRAMRLALRRSFPAPLARWHRVRDDIYKNIYQTYWNPKLQSFVQYRGAKTVDAASLLLPLVKFISPTDPALAIHTQGD